MANRTLKALRLFFAKSLAPFSAPDITDLEQRLAAFNIDTQTIFDEQMAKVKELHDERIAAILRGED